MMNLLFANARWVLVAAAIVSIQPMVISSAAAQKAEVPSLSVASSSPEVMKFFFDYFEQTLRDSPEYATSIA
jgi:hypothetical protein